MIGKIKKWDRHKGYGFVSCSEGTAFLHVTKISPEQPRGVELQGREVDITETFEAIQGLKVISCNLIPEVVDLAAERALREELGPATLIVAKGIWSNHHNFDIYLDGIYGLRTGIYNGDVVKIKVPSRKKMAYAARGEFNLRPGGVYVIAHASGVVTVSTHTGLKELHNYSDHYGGRWVGLYELVSDKWVLEYDVPSYGSYRYHRFVGDNSSFEEKKGG